MKIGSLSSASADAAALARASSETGTAAARAREAQEVSSTSSVKLSSTASGLLAGTATPEFDAAKVERMKQAIADGSFKVNAQTIADKMIANAAELLDATPRKP